MRPHDDHGSAVIGSTSFHQSRVGGSVEDERGAGQEQDPQPEKPPKQRTWMPAHSTTDQRGGNQQSGRPEYDPGAVKTGPLVSEREHHSGQPVPPRPERSAPSHRDGQPRRPGWRSGTDFPRVQHAIAARNPSVASHVYRVEHSTRVGHLPFLLIQLTERCCFLWNQSRRMDGRTLLRRLANCTENQYCAQKFGRRQIRGGAGLVALSITGRAPRWSAAANGAARTRSTRLAPRTSRAGRSTR